MRPTLVYLSGEKKEIANHVLRRFSPADRAYFVSTRPEQWPDYIATKHPELLGVDPIIIGGAIAGIAGITTAIIGGVTARMQQKRAAAMQKQATEQELRIIQAAQAAQAGATQQTAGIMANMGLPILIIAGIIIFMVNRGE